MHEVKFKLSWTKQMILIIPENGPDFQSLTTFQTEPNLSASKDTREQHIMTIFLRYTIIKKSWQFKLSPSFVWTNIVTRTHT